MLSNNHLRHRLPVFHLRYGLTALAKLNFCILLISLLYLFLRFAIFCIIRLDVALLFLAMVLFFISKIASIYHSPVSGSTVYLSFSFLSIARARL